MKFEYLKEFVTLSKTRNYSVCADAHYISQPSLTRHIQELEKEYGIQLFERTSRGIVLTEAGEIFLPYAQELVETQTRCSDAISQYLNRKNGMLSVGSIYAMEQYHITSILGAWAKESPSVRMRIMEEDSQEVLHWLRQGVVDYAFIREDFPNENSDLNRLHITTDKLVCLVPENHPFASYTSISLPQLKNETFVSYEDCPLVRNLLLGAGLGTNIPYSGAKGRNAVNLVKQGLGIMLQFRTPIDDSELGGFCILDIEPAIISDINFVYQGSRLSESGKLFVKFIKHYLQLRMEAADQSA